MKLLLVLLVGAAVTVAVGLVEGEGWTGYVIGAVLALALWVMLFFGQAGTGRGWVPVTPATFAACAAVAVALGAASRLLLGTGSSWAVGFILAGVLWPVTVRARRDRQPG